MNNRTFWFLVGLLPSVGVFVGAAAAEWIDGPDSQLHEDYVNAQHYDEPLCPPGTVPMFFGVVIVDGLSRPIYTCSDAGTGEVPVEVGWEQLEAEATQGP